MFNIMDWMPKVQDKADPKKKKVRKKKSEKLQDGGLEVIDEANQEEASLELSDGEDMEMDIPYVIETERLRR